MRGFAAASHEGRAGRNLTGSARPASTELYSPSAVVLFKNWTLTDALTRAQEGKSTGILFLPGSGRGRRYADEPHMSTN